MNLIGKFVSRTNLMHQMPIKDDLDRNLSTIMHEAHHKARAERGRLTSEFATRGVISSTGLIGSVVERLNQIHSESIEQAMQRIHYFFERMQEPPSRITAWARPHLENMGNTLLGQIPSAGHPAEQQRIRTQYNLVFQQRLDGAIRDIEIGLIAGRPVPSGQAKGISTVPYQATVIQVMIASPGDVLEERNVARDVINEWTYMHFSPSNPTVLIPVGWETHSSPDLSGRPQQIINDRVLKNCDLLVGIFWTKLGTPTGESASGTAEEIERHIAAGKPAMVYFSVRPVALDSVDANQYAALQQFKDWCKTKGLIATFENIPDFQTKFTRQLQLTLRDNPYIANLLKRSTVNQTPQNIVVAEEPTTPVLSDEAVQLLLEGTGDKSGIIMKLAYIGGEHIQTNGKQFGDPRDRRSQARWEYALEQLENEKLVAPAGDKRQIFKITDLGYQLADKIRPS